MKIRHIFLLGSAMLALFSCTPKNQVKINGEIKDGGKQKVYLELLNVDNILLVDSTTTNKKGQFQFKREVTTPTFYNIKVGQNGQMTIIAEPDSQIKLTGELKNLSNNYWVDGSESSLWVKMLNFKLHNTLTSMDSLRNLYNTLPETPENEARKQEISDAWDTITEKQIRFSKDFILKHAVSPASYYALYQKFDPENFILSPQSDLHSYKIVATAMKAMFPESQYTQAILKHLALISKNSKALRLQELIAKSESSLPEIKLPDSKGDTLSLKATKAKLIVLDFTVLSGKDSKAHAAEMKTVYNKFHDKGVEIFQVCLDPNYLLWQNLIRQYGITWPCVWDADAEKSRAARLWNVQSIPANYVINAKSEVVGKDLYGRRLEDRLNDLLK